MRLALFGAVSVAAAACAQQEMPTIANGEKTDQAESVSQSLSSTYNSTYFNNTFAPQGYVCKINDEFGGSLGAGDTDGTEGPSYLDPNKWMFENFYANNEAENYTSRQCADPAWANGNWNYCVSKGYLRVRAINDYMDCTNNTACGTFWGGQGGVRNYTSGRIISKHKVALEYGYVEFKARLPFQGVAKQSGVWPAIWFLGDDISEGPAPGSTPWPWAPEFDLLEWQSPNGKMASNAIFIGNDGNMDACNAWPEGGGPDCTDQNGAQSGGRGQFKMNDWSAQGAYQGWHVYGLEWTSTYMKPYIDGVLQGTVNTTGGASEYNEPMFIIINMALGGDLGGTIAVTDWSKINLDVDYMRWYQKGGADTCADPGGSNPPPPTATCSDGLQNQGEYGVDCGGPCVPCAASAVVYKDCNYGGAYAVTLPVGTYTTAQLVAKGIVDNDISSLRVAPGYQAVIYQTDNFTGFTTTLTGQTSCLTDTGAGRTSGNWNDDTSSVQIQAVGTTQPPVIGAGSTVRAETGVGVGTQLEYTPANGSSGTTVGYLDSGDTITFNNVNLTGVGGLNMRVAGANTGTVLEAHADSGTGTLLGSYTMTSTGGWAVWTDRSMSFTTSVSGSHALVLKGGTGGSGILNIETLTLVSSAPKPATCSDGIQNQGETGVDCGGPCSTVCNGGAGFTLVASSRTGNSGTLTETCSEGGLDVNDVGNGEWISFDNVNFAGIGSFEARTASAGYAGTIEFHRDSTTGPLLATCSAPVTGGWQTYTSVTCSLTAAQTGTGSLYLLFKGGSSGNGLPNIRYVKGIAGAVACDDSCTAHSYACGSFTNACGANLNCGTCASGWTCSASKTCTPPSSSNNPGTREAEAGTLVGGYVDGGNGVVVNASNGSICWSNVNMTGNTQLTMTYGNGEPLGDTMKVTFNGTQIGAAMSVTNTGGWNTFDIVQTTFGAQSGTGTLCLAVGAYSAWVAKVDKVSFQ